jgi:hypothetical protein
LVGQYPVQFVLGTVFILENFVIASYRLLVRIFKVSWFSRFAAKEGIRDSELKDIVKDVLEAGKADVDLGAGVYKIRFARSGEGKSGGYRVIVFFKSGLLTFYVYGFAKSDRGNISRKEIRQFKETAKDWLALTDKQLDELIKMGKYQEIGG